MKTGTARLLAPGQIWKTGVADIEILALGKRRIHYQITVRLGGRHVSAQISGIEAMAAYLKANRAQLVEGASNN
jgi:hypothetical protein